MIEDLKSPVCLVTGGSSGIGLATARLFFRDGYRVAFCGRDQQRLQTAVDQIVGAQPAGDEMTNRRRVYSVVADLADVNAAKGLAEQVVEHFGRVDVLVNNAALAPLSPFGAISAEDFENSTNVNIRSVFYLTQAVWKTMLNQRSGTIVNISSMSAVDPFPGFSLYGASKAWVDLMTHSLAAEGESSGIRVCSIRPGAVETPLLRGLFPDFPPEQCVQPEEIADVVMGCVTSPESYPSGKAFPVVQPPADE
jgi:NAD(P)-dependent dehydrogenase (short-subunit alcohol dehydrogenase family)